MSQEQAHLGSVTVDGSGRMTIPAEALKLMGVGEGDRVLALRGPREGSVLIWPPSNKSDQRSVVVEVDGWVVLPDDARKALYIEDGGGVVVLRGPRPRCVIVWPEDAENILGKGYGF